MFHNLFCFYQFNIFLSARGFIPNSQASLSAINSQAPTGIASFTNPSRFIKPCIINATQDFQSKLKGSEKMNTIKEFGWRKAGSYYSYQWVNTRTRWYCPPPQKVTIPLTPKQAWKHNFYFFLTCFPNLTGKWTPSSTSRATQEVLALRRNVIIKTDKRHPPQTHLQWYLWES